MSRRKSGATGLDLLRLLGRQRLAYVSSMLALAVTYTAERMFTAWMVVRVAAALTAGDRSSLTQTLLTAALFYPAYAACIPLSFVPFRMSIQRGLANLRERLFAQMLRLPFADQIHTGAAQSLLGTDVQTLEDAYNRHFWGLVQSTFQGIGSVVAMLWLEPRLALVSLAASLLAVSANLLAAKPLRQSSRLVQAGQALIAERLSDLLAGAEVIRSFSIGQLILARFSDANCDTQRAALRRARTQAVLQGAGNLVLTVFFIPMAIGAYWILTGRAAFANVLGVSQLSLGAFGLLMSIGSAFSRFQGALAAADRVKAVLATPSENATAGAPGRLPLIPDTDHGGSHHSEALSLEGVCFTYDADHPVLSDLSLAVAHGQTVAVVGPSGGGKSTLLRLLLGFYVPTAGLISVEGRPQSEYELRDLRRRFAYVPQDAYLFAGTVAENIRLGRPGATDDEIRAAATAANAAEFIERLPMGYDTSVGERGAQLSGGQRQRIAIARAVLRDAPILLLDEATSALDTESESLVQEALTRLMAGRTTVVVAHRLATIEHADEIAVLDGGRIIERGRHADLLALGGVYHRLCEAARVDPA